MGDAEDLGDGEQRQLGRHVDHEVALAGGGDAVEGAVGAGRVVELDEGVELVLELVLEVLLQAGLRVDFAP